MAKLKFDKTKSLEVGEPILEVVQETETFAEREQEVKPEQESANVETKVSTPTKAELQLAQQLSGTPHAFDSEYQSVLESLARYGIAAYFNGDWGRGHKWHQFCK